MSTATKHIASLLATAIDAANAGWDGLEWDTDLTCASVGDERQDGTAWTEEALDAARTEEAEAVATDAAAWTALLSDAEAACAAARFGALADCLEEMDRLEAAYGDKPATTLVRRSIQAALRRWLVASGIASGIAEDAVRDLDRALRDLRAGAAELAALIDDPDLRAGWDSAADAASVVADGGEDDEALATWEVYCDEKASGIRACGPIAKAACDAWCALRAAATRAYAAEA